MAYPWVLRGGRRKATRVWLNFEKKTMCHTLYLRAKNVNLNRHRKFPAPCFTENWRDVTLIKYEGLHRLLSSPKLILSSWGHEEPTVLLPKLCYLSKPLTSIPAIKLSTDRDSDFPSAQLVLPHQSYKEWNSKKPLLPSFYETVTES